MKNFRTFFLIVMGVMAVSAAHAQSSFSMQYSISSGVNDVKTYINGASFRGFAMEYKKFVSANVAIGGEVSWNVFYERRAFDTYTVGNTSVSGFQYRYINAVPLLVTGTYYLKKDQKINPYVGLGVGALSMNRKTDMGLYSYTQDSWHFALRPEVGVQVNANDQMDVLFAAKYIGGFATDAMTTQSYFSFNIGFVWKKGW